MLFQNILALCKERGISISKLEKEIGLGNATIRGWGMSSPTVENVRKVAEFFGVSIDDLVGYAITKEVFARMNRYTKPPLSMVCQR